MQSQSQTNTEGQDPTRAGDEPASSVSGSVDASSANAPAAPAKEPMTKQLVKQAIGLVLAGGLLYWTFKDANWSEILKYAQSLNPLYLAALSASALMSHLIRAWRWCILLQPLTDKKVSLWNSFCAVMYGYAVNIPLPRGGEVARLVAMSKSENIPWAGVLPTMFIDRLLDIAMLVLLLGVTMVVYPIPKDLSWLVLAGRTLCVATVAGLIALPFVGRIGAAVMNIDAVKKMIPAAIAEKLTQLLDQFDQGTRSLKNPVMIPVIGLMSFVIWFFYYLNIYCVVLAFNLQNVVDLSKTLIVFTIGSIGVLVPTPGSAGSYHALISQSLQRVAGIDQNQALAFATILHFACFIVLTCVPAAICFLIQSRRFGKTPS